MENYDVVIVGSGFVGANMAYLLAQQQKRVLILEAGPGLEHSREDYMENFFLNTFKSPSSPYPPNDNALDPANTYVPRPTIQALVETDANGDPTWSNPDYSYFVYSEGSKPFASTYERLAGGTGNHWMGTCLRMTDNDMKTNTLYGYGLDWPIAYSDIEDYYGIAESLIGVSADVSEQELIGTLFPAGYEYPMQSLPKSHWDQVFAASVDGQQLTSDNSSGALVTGTPAGRNSQPGFDVNRRVCHGNTNCTPICPIQAKYDTQYTLRKAFDTGYVDMISRAVVNEVMTDGNNVTSVNYLTYEGTFVDPQNQQAIGNGTATGDVYVLAAHAVENARILLHSDVANSSGLVGRHLMDHPIYLAWGLMPVGNPSYCYRGPIATSGVENLRDGGFRNNRAPWRIEIGNEGWNWPITDPYTTGMDYVYGTNNGGLNDNASILSNSDYIATLNGLLTRQFRMGFLVEQEADPGNRVELSLEHTDGLGLRRPKITYDLSDHTRAGFKSAKEATDTIMALLGATQYTATDASAGTTFEYENTPYNYNGAGHLCGTHVMGTNSGNSVVDSFQRSWDYPNLYIAGCGSMPSIGTQNPTLTMLALCARTVDDIVGSA